MILALPIHSNDGTSELLPWRQGTLIYSTNLRCTGSQPHFLIDKN
jgi:hypothetical protein